MRLSIIWGPLLAWLIRIHENIDDKSEQEKLDIIGQFGVGFYSAYMVARKVVVETFSPFASTGYIFSSNGIENYEISEQRI